MSTVYTKPTWIRVVVTGISVDPGNVPAEAEIPQVPFKGVIRRARAVVTAGGATQIAMEVREAAGATGLGVALSYALTPTAIDSLEEVMYQVAPNTPVERWGALIVSLVTNNAAAQTVSVSFDIQPLV